VSESETQGSVLNSEDVQRACSLCQLWHEINVVTDACMMGPNQHLPLFLGRH